MICPNCQNSIASATRLCPRCGCNPQVVINLNVSYAVRLTTHQKIQLILPWVFGCLGLATALALIYIHDPQHDAIDLALSVVLWLFTSLLSLLFQLNALRDIASGIAYVHIAQLIRTGPVFVPRVYRQYAHFDTLGWFRMSYQLWKTAQVGATYEITYSRYSKRLWQAIPKTA